jgi:hypothetical protein
MSRSKEKDAGASQTNNSTAESTQGKSRPGLPNKASVVSEKTFISPKGKRYRIIRTDEMDAYDAPVSPEEQRSKKR